jgi:hypothetical protein
MLREVIFCWFTRYFTEGGIPVIRTPVGNSHLWEEATCYRSDNSAFRSL